MLCDTPPSIILPKEKDVRLGQTWATSLGRTLRRVLLPATGPSPMWGSRFVGARAVEPWVGEQKPLGKTLLRGNPSPEMTYLPTYLRVASGSQEDPGHRRAEQEAPRKIPIRLTTEALAARGDSLQHVR